jgi:hypothetical protein
MQLNPGMVLLYVFRAPAWSPHSAKPAVKDNIEELAKKPPVALRALGCSYSGPELLQYQFETEPHVPRDNQPFKQI